VSATGSRLITLASSGTIGIAGVFAPNTANSYIPTGSTVDFNGSGAQTIPNLNYNNLTTSNGGIKTMLTTVTAGGNLTINDGTILTYSSAASGFTLIVTGNITLNNSSQLTITDLAGAKNHALNLGGNLLVNAGSIFNMANGDDKCHVTFTKAGDQLVGGGGSITFNTIGLNKSGVANRVLCSSSVGVGGTAGATDAINFSAGTWEQAAGTMGYASNNSQQLFGAQGKLSATGTGSINFGGTLIVSNCSFLVNTTGTINVAGATSRLEISNTGNVQLQAGTMNIGGRLFNNASTLIISGWYCKY
jgi:hypothetical protein